MIGLPNLQKENEDTSKRIHELERKVDAKQKLEIENEKLRRKIVLKKHPGDKDDVGMEKTMKELKEEIEEKQEEIDGLERLNQTLVVKERQSNNELQEARKELIAV